MAPRNSSAGPSIVPVAGYRACQISWRRWDFGLYPCGTVVCGVHSAGCRYSAGIAAWRIHTGTIEGSALTYEDFNGPYCHSGRKYKEGFTPRTDHHVHIMYRS